MLRELTAQQLAEMIAYEKIDRVPVTPEEELASKEKAIKERMAHMLGSRDR